MYLFLDTNTFLSFYLFSKDSLDELKKLAALIKEKEITLFLPSQVVDELYRNREAKICESLKRMKDQFPKPQIPRIAESYDEYDELIKLAASCEEIKLSLLKKIEDDVETKSLVADKLIDKIVKNSKITELSSEILGSVHERIDKGNPPGKKGSLGDAIIWVTILQKFPFEEDLYFVSNDGDFASPLNRLSMNKFLEDEFNNINESRIFYYHNLAEFLNDKFSEIRIHSVPDPEIEYEIWRLQNSFSFSKTHEVISELKKFDAFTIEQVMKILEIYLTNTQVLWIINDDDVKSFVRNLIEDYSTEIPESVIEQIELKISEENNSSGDDIPF